MLDYDQVIHLFKQRLHQNIFGILIKISKTLFDELDDTQYLCF